MHKIIIFLSCLICLVAARRLGIERQLWWQQNVRQQKEEPTKLAPETISGRLKQMQDQQLFLFDVLLQVHKPLINQKLIELGKVLINDPAMYSELIDEMLLEFLEKCRQHEILGRDKIYSDLNMEHVRQMIGLTKFLTLAKDWPTFQRNVCFARLHMNPVIFVNALLRAIRERTDTSELIVPAMNEILPQLFYDMEVIKTAESVDWHDLLTGPKMSVRPSLMNILHLNRIVNAMSAINWIHIVKSRRSQPLRVQTGNINDLNNIERLQANTINDPSNVILKSEIKVVIPVEERNPLSYLTDDVGLNIFWNEAMNERLIQTLTSEKQPDNNWSKNWDKNEQIGVTTELRDVWSRQDEIERNNVLGQRDTLSRNRNINNKWIPVEENADNLVPPQERRQTIDKTLQQEHIQGQMGVENLPSSNAGSERLLHVGRRHKNLSEMRNDEVLIERENIREPVRPKMEQSQSLWMNRENIDQSTWMNRQSTQTQRDIDTEETDWTSNHNQAIVGNNNIHRIGNGRVVVDRNTNFPEEDETVRENDINSNERADRNTNSPGISEHGRTDDAIVKEYTIISNDPANRMTNKPWMSEQRFSMHQDTVKEDNINSNTNWVNNERVFVEKDNNNQWNTWAITNNAKENSPNLVRESKLWRGEPVDKSLWDNIVDGDRLVSRRRMDEREHGVRMSRSIKNLSISPTENLMSARSGEIFIQNLQQLMARINMEKMSLNLKEFENVDEISLPQLLTTNGVQYQKRAVSQVVARQKIQQTIQQLQAIIDQKLDRARIELNNPEVLRIIGDILIENNGQLGNVWDELYNQINVFVYGQLSSDELQQQATVLSTPSGNLHEPIYLDIVQGLNKLIDSYVQNLQPYTREQLIASGVVIKSIDVDQLVTYFDFNDADLINLVDQQLLQTSTSNMQRSQKKLVARQKRLNHKQFTLDYEILSKSNQLVVVRTFIGPKINDPSRQKDKIRQNFMLLDAFVRNLETGLNRIERNSRDITWTAGDTSTLSEIYRIVMSDMPLQNMVTPNCRFPHRLIIPRGRIDGFPVQLFVVVTSVTEEDLKVQRMVNPNRICGLGVAGMSLDTLPLNFPLDRKIQNPMEFLQDNMMLKDVLVVHDDRDEVSSD